MGDQANRMGPILSPSIPIRAWRLSISCGAAWHAVLTAIALLGLHDGPCEAGTLPVTRGTGCAAASIMACVNP